MDIGMLIDYLSDVVSLVIPLLLGLAVIVFFWGIILFVANAGDEKKVEEGRTFMVWGMIGIFVIVALWGIVGYFQDTFGLNTFISLGDLPEQSDTIPTP